MQFLIQKNTKIVSVFLSRTKIEKIFLTSGNTDKVEEVPQLITLDPSG